MSNNPAQSQSSHNVTSSSGNVLASQSQTINQQLQRRLEVLSTASTSQSQSVVATTEESPVHEGTSLLNQFGGIRSQSASIGRVVSTQQALNQQSAEQKKTNKRWFKKK